MDVVRPNDHDLESRLRKWDPPHDQSHVRDKNDSVSFGPTTSSVSDVIVLDVLHTPVPSFVLIDRRLIKKVTDRTSHREFPFITPSSLFFSRILL